ncbi:MAG: ELWxxDGT repeat protein, partial [Pirellulales bacterium]
MELWRTDGTTDGTQLVKDLTDPGDPGSWSDPQGLVVASNELYFSAWDPDHGRELWKSDGTADGTVLVRDVNPNGDGLLPTWGYGRRPTVRTPLGDRLLFAANDSQTGLELWSTDGTETGTVQVKDLTAPSDPYSWSDPQQLVVADGQLYFSAWDPEHDHELWRTDGTSEGTVLAKDFNPNGGSNFGFAGRAGANGEKLIFWAQDENGVQRLWASDGSAPFTPLLDINIQLGEVGTSLGERLLFSANDGTHGLELWATDGTPEGTGMLADVIMATADSAPRDFVQFAGAAYFGAYDNAGWGLFRHDPDVAGGATLVKRVGNIDRLRVFGKQLLFVSGSALWTSDGTEAGTALLKDTGQWISSNLLPVGEDLYFGTQGALWKSDGTAAGTQTVRSGFDSPLELTVAGGTVFFTASDGQGGRELWVSDGTSAGTRRLKDIFPGGGWSNPQSLIGVGNLLFFTADDGEHGRELWQSDGTAAGTRLVKDLLPGGGWSNPDQLRAVGDQLLFTADDVIHGRELWVTDGTADGTKLAADLNAVQRPEGSNPGTFFRAGDVNYFWTSDPTGRRALWRTDGPQGPTLLREGFTGWVGERQDLGGRLLFTADDGLAGGELWTSDGTPAGTVLLRDILPGAFGSPPSELTVLGNLAYFAASDGPRGRELWRTDGTESGTVMVRDINPGGGGSYPASLRAVGSQLFFTAGDNAGGRELWKSDGTRGGTTRVKDIWPGAPSSYLNDFRALGDKLLFAADDGQHGRELWTSDGTEAGTSLLADIGAAFTAGSFATQYVRAGSATYFVADDGVHGQELWKTDGTAAGTELVKDILPGRDGTGISWLTALGDQVLFSAYTPQNGSTLWRSDGTATGTRRLANNLFNPAELVVFRDAAYFAGDGAFGRELWKSDGTAAYQVKDILRGGNSAAPSSLRVVGDTLFFSADDGVHGRELWKSDGTAEGTVLVADVRAEIVQAANAGQFTQVDNLVYFTASDPLHGQELWVSDGTSAGTRLLKDIVSGGDGSSISWLTALGDQVLFSAYSPTPALLRTLWRSDGTTAGTRRISKDFINPAELVEFHDAVYFAVDGHHGRELWKSDGTAAGTSQVKDIFPGGALGESSSPSGFCVVGDTLYFSANDGVHGRELWKSDGTSEGTVLVADVWPGSQGSDPETLRAVGDLLTFSATDPEHGRELWRSDGTETGTQLIVDVNAQPSETPLPDPSSFVGAGAWTYLVSNKQLWRTDGATAGTVQVAGDFRDPSELTDVGGTLFFVARDADHGQELWKVDRASVAATIVRDIFAGPQGASPSWLVGCRGVLLFAASDGGPERLWASDGTPDGTRLVEPAPAGFANPRELTSAAGVVFFSATDDAHGAELWSTDGTAAGTALVRDIQTGVFGSYPTQITQVGSQVYFIAGDEEHGRELWRSDGSEEGTVRVTDQTSAFSMLDPIDVNGMLFFRRSSEALWRSDGTADGTRQLTTGLYFAPQLQGYGEDMATLDGALYFLAQKVVDGGFGHRNLWKSDGTPEGTVQVTEDQPALPQELVALNGDLYISAYLPHGSDWTPAIWKSDGTRTGTEVLARNLSARQFAAVDGRLYFSGYDYDDPQGSELWTSNGTEAGTHPVRAAAPTQDSHPIPLSVWQNVLYFAADDGLHGSQLWRSDGTTAGTRVVAEVSPFAPTLTTGVEVHGHLLFEGRTAVGELGLWSTDGTAAGTVLVKSAPNGMFLAQITVLAGAAYFLIQGDNRIELWQSDGTPAGTQLFFTA